ncbi:DUF1800 domain-containing protein [bacterium]|nr:DUF1800 domain-containing protein [bacterium]
MKGLLESLPRGQSRRVPRKTHRLSFMPYDPNLVSDLESRLRLSKNRLAKILESTEDNGGSVAEFVRLIDKRSSVTPTEHPKHAGTTNADQVRHLLSRASFGLSVAESQVFGSAPISDLVDALLTDYAMPSPPGEWVNEPFDWLVFRELSPEEQQAFFMQNNERINEFRGWWLAQMMGIAFNLRERMTLFWHGHFTSDLEAGVLAQLLYKQIDTLRRNALGNFRDFLKEIYKDPTMLLYLDGASNIAQQPNENFARELLELFTLGVGNYTEKDIKEAARAFSGWQLDLYNLTSFLNPTLHDYGLKTFLGQTGNFDGDDIIDIILQQAQTAKHIARAVYEHFVSREPDEEVIDSLAKTFRSNDYEIKPMLRELFTNEHFYSDHAIGSLIKAPVEMAALNARALSVQNLDPFFVLFTTAIQDQELMNPPNVAGWPGQRNWISPTTYVTRNTINEVYVNPDLIRNDVGEPFMEFDPLAFARSFGTEDARTLAQAMVDHLLRISVSEETLNFLVTTLIGTADPSDWSLDYPGADRQVQAFLVQVIRLPEYHLT